MEASYHTLKRTHSPRSTHRKKLYCLPRYTALKERQQATCWVAHSQPPSQLQRMPPERKKNIPKKQQQNKLCKQSSDVLWNLGLKRGTKSFFLQSEHSSSRTRKGAANTIKMLIKKSGHLVFTEEI